MGLMLVACSSGPSNALVVDEDSAAPADYEYVIPQGTSERIRGGEPIAILPAELEVHVGEIIRIINQDDVGHFIGIFYVGPREVVTQRFASPGTFIGNCTVHPSGQISLRVLE
jgi:plastocyanin